MLKAVLFDVDGTIAETEELHRRAFNATFAELGLDLSWSQDEYRGLLRVTGGKERITAYFRSRGVEMPAEEVAGIHRRKTEIYVDDLTAGRITLRRVCCGSGSSCARKGCRWASPRRPPRPTSIPSWRPCSGRSGAAILPVSLRGIRFRRRSPLPMSTWPAWIGLALLHPRRWPSKIPREGSGPARAAGIPVVVTPSSYTDQDDFSCADCVLPSLGDPEQPWDAAQPGFPRRWVDLEDLRRIVAQAGQG